MKERQKIIQREFKKIAREQGLTEKQINEVEDSMWKFIKEQIQSTDTVNEINSNIYLRFLGTIFIAPGRLKKIKENIKK
jgi:hypothetical protein